MAASSALKITKTDSPVFSINDGVMNDKLSSPSLLLTKSLAPTLSKPAQFQKLVLSLPTFLPVASPYPSVNTNLGPDPGGWNTSGWVIQSLINATYADAIAWIKEKGLRIKVENPKMGWTLDTRDKDFWYDVDHALSDAAPYVVAGIAVVSGGILAAGLLSGGAVAAGGAAEIASTAGTAAVDLSIPLASESLAGVTASSLITPISTAGVLGSITPAVIPTAIGDIALASQTIAGSSASSLITPLTLTTKSVGVLSSLADLVESPLGQVGANLLKTSIAPTAATTAAASLTTGASNALNDVAEKSLSVAQQALFNSAAGNKTPATTTPMNIPTWVWWAVGLTFGVPVVIWILVKLFRAMFK